MLTIILLVHIKNDSIGIYLSESMANACHAEYAILALL